MFIFRFLTYFALSTVARPLACARNTGLPFARGRLLVPTPPHRFSGLWPSVLTCPCGGASSCLPVPPTRTSVLWGQGWHSSCSLSAHQHTQSKYHRIKMVSWVWFCLKVFGKVGWKMKLATEWTHFSWAWEAKAGISGPPIFPLASRAA